LDDFSFDGGAGVAGCAGAGGAVAGGVVVVGAAGAASAGLFSAGGVAGAGVAGAAGVVGAGAVAPGGTTDRLPGLAATIVNASVFTMKMIAAASVALESTVADPRCPNAVWLEPPPNVPDQSALLPCCKSTTRIRNRQTIT
jgi:hypothetical protein